MSREDKLIKLMSDVDEIIQHLQAAEWMQQNLRQRLPKLKITDKEIKMLEEEHGFYYKEALDEAEVI